mmetsp:Transcript_23527/g.76658  ORF Transcript_23527/g.76658 Transcript_23527/m.76658 type:complete len:174 (+) Transcript_23527:354-875(+)
MCACKTIGPKPDDDQIVNFLIEQRANVDLQDEMGDTALHVAAATRDPSIPLLPTGYHRLLQALMAGKANVNIYNKLGQTALHRASLVQDNDPCVFVACVPLRSDPARSLSHLEPPLCECGCHQSIALLNRIRMSQPERDTSYSARKKRMHHDVARGKCRSGDDGSVCNHPARV